MSTVKTSTSIVMKEERIIQKESVVDLLRMADWATLCIESWHEQCPKEISGIDSYLFQFKEAITQLCTEMNIAPPQWC